MCGTINKENESRLTCLLLVCHKFSVDGRLEFHKNDHAFTLLPLSWRMELQQSLLWKNTFQVSSPILDSSIFLTFGWISVPFKRPNENVSRFIFCFAVFRHLCDSYWQPCLHPLATNVNRNTSVLWLVDNEIYKKYTVIRLLACVRFLPKKGFLLIHGIPFKNGQRTEFALSNS